MDWKLVVWDWRFVLAVVLSVVVYSEELVRKMVYKAYHTAKDLIDDGKINNSISED